MRLACGMLLQATKNVGLIDAGSICELSNCGLSRARNPIHRRNLKKLAGSDLCTSSPLSGGSNEVGVRRPDLIPKERPRLNPSEETC
jgi:hypothetical protein